MVRGKSKKVKLLLLPFAMNDFVFNGKEIN